MDGGTVDTLLIELKKGARRSQMIKTNAYKYKYIIKGKVEYQIGEKKYVLEEGDSLFFDGRFPHRAANSGNTDALMLVIYFFLTGKEG